MTSFLDYVGNRPQTLLDISIRKIAVTNMPLLDELKIQMFLFCIDTRICKRLKENLLNLLWISNNSSIPLSMCTMFILFLLYMDFKF